MLWQGELLKDEAGNEILGPHVLGSPYLLTILPGPTLAMFTSVSGPATESLTVGELTTFGIVARDRFGNRRTEGNDIIDVVFKVGCHCACQPASKGVSRHAFGQGVFPYGRICAALKV